jgi:hypothetical protein
MTLADQTYEEEPLLASIRLSPIATVISNPRLPDNPVVAANEAFCLLTGYDHTEIVGRNCRFLAGADTEPWQTDKIRDAIRLQRPTLTELLNHKKDGTPFRNAVWWPRSSDLKAVSTISLGRRWRCPTRLPPCFGETLGALVKVPLPPPARDIGRNGRRLPQQADRLAPQAFRKTVKMHRSLMMDKLGVGTSADAVRIAVEAGL